MQNGILNQWMNEWKYKFRQKVLTEGRAFIIVAVCMRFKKIRLEQTNAIYLDMFTITLSTSCTVFVNVAMNWNWHNFRFVPKSNRNVQFLLKRIFLWKKRIFFFVKKISFRRKSRRFKSTSIGFCQRLNGIKTDWHSIYANNVENSLDSMTDADHDLSSDLFNKFTETRAFNWMGEFETRKMVLCIIIIYYS